VNLRNGSRSNPRNILVALVFLCFTLLHPVHAAAGNSAARFAGTDGKLDTREAALYLAVTHNKPLSDFLHPETLQIDPEQVVAVMEDQLDDLRSLTGHEAPWRVDEIDKLYLAGIITVPERPREGWKNIKGLTKAAIYTDSNSTRVYGPIRLRKTTDDLRFANIEDASGVTIGYSDNRLVDGRGAWNTQGVLGYPISFHSQGKPGKSAEFELLPAINWRIASIEGVANSDIEELGFSLPMVLFLSPGGNVYSGTYDQNVAAAKGKILSRLWVLTARPFVQTDFSLHHRICGAEASAEYIGGVFGSGLYMGGYQNSGIDGLQYKLRIVPGIDFSSTGKTGRFTTRLKGDDMFRVGGLLSCNLRFDGPSFTTFDIGTSYEMFHALDSSIEDADLLRTYASLWLNKNVGMSFEYCKGNTPVSLKAIDLLSLGLEFRY